jgi:hypothetical protein
MTAATVATLEMVEMEAMEEVVAENKTEFIERMEGSKHLVIRLGAFLFGMMKPAS